MKPSQKCNPLLSVYLLHLLVPAFLLTDFVTAWIGGQVRPRLSSFDTAVAGVSAAWLAAGLGAILLSRDRQRFARTVTGLLVTIYVVYATLLLAEGFLHAVPFVSPIPGQLAPGRSKLGPVDPIEFPGVQGIKTFTINRLGLRGPLPPVDRSIYRIVVIGGSTSICTYLDDFEDWPHVLMETMNAGHQHPVVWVGNAAVSGQNTMHHVVLMQWLPGVLDFDAAVFLLGGNDMNISLAFNGAPTQQALEKFIGWEGDLPPGTLYRTWHPYYERLQLTRLARLGLGGLPDILRGSRGERPPDLDVAAYRRQRAAGPVVPLPDLHTGLEEYRYRLLKVVSLCRNIGRRCVFLTQPGMWRNDLSPAELRLLWAGRVGSLAKPTGFVAAADMERAMDSFNGVLRDVCRSDGLECYDLAVHVPKDTSAFYDDVHFNEAGARLTAQNVKEYLLSQPPFRSGAHR